MMMPDMEKKSKPHAEMAEDIESPVSPADHLPQLSPDSDKTTTDGEKQPTYLTSWRLGTVILSLCLGIFLFGLDTNIIGTAIPRITTEFNSLQDISWYGSAYLLTATAFQPIFGSLYKFFPAKIVYMISLVIFEAGSAMSAAAPSSAVLILGRAILGLGAAGLLQGALAIIGNVVELSKVPLYQGIVVGALGISLCVGPVLGGAFTDHASWRWCFWINVPIGACVLVAVSVLVPLKQRSNEANRALPLKEKLKNMDAVGTVLFLGAVCCILLALVWGGEKYPWSDSKIIGLFVGAGLMTVCLCVNLWKRGETAIIPLRVLRQRSIAMGALVLFGLGIFIQPYAYYLPVFFQSAQGVSTTESGVRFIALLVPQIVTLVIVGGIVTKYGYYVPFMVVGLAIACVGSGLMTTISISTPTVQWAAYLVICGIGSGMAQQLPYIAVQAALDPADVPTGNAIAVFTFQFASALGLAIGQNLFIAELRSAVPRHTLEVSPDQVVAVGASGLSLLTQSPETLHALRSAFSESLRPVFILSLVGICIAFPPACAMERKNIKHVAAERERLQKAEKEQESSSRDSASQIEKEIVTVTEEKV
ncbi:major facilitator superfamily domain-containing protein [Cladorrhinum sp. PSN259]|nr:major facilitator superfamily domain-containing protein [Cladorrhinum sp. PSN259]